MADATAIQAVSAALQTLLQDQLSVLAMPPGSVKIESIDLIPDPVPPPRVTLFLYNVHEDPFLKNRDPQIVPAGPGAAVVRPPPIVVDLDYMVCAWMSTTTEEHLVLGDVLRVFHDNAQLDPAMLGPAWRADETVQVTLANPSIEDQARIWTTFGFKRFKLALYYRTRVVPIASNRTFSERVVLSRNANAQSFRPTDPGDVPVGVP